MKSRNHLLLKICQLSFFLSLAACGGGGSSSSSSPELKTGVLVDSAVENVTYNTATQSGVTSSTGEFTYRDGETITFSIGDLIFPPATAEAVVTPLILAGATSITDTTATNIARLLQSLDSDGDPSNGITISATAASAAAAVNFNVAAATFASDPAVTNLIANSGSVTTALISEADAQDHLLSSLFPVFGAWAFTGGSEFNYLILMPNNTFVYAENDLSAVSPEENGLEVGTYSYNSVSGSITFNIAYDDNDPDNDSGAGDIGTPATLASSLSNGNNTLSIAGLVLNSQDFSSGPAVAGAWAFTSGTEFNYLILMSNNTFVYAENDLSAVSPEENGLEVGTYTYDIGTGDITFNIVYDDNDPGNDSGVGDIGTPATLDSSLSNGNNTLSISGLVLTKILP